MHFPSDPGAPTASHKISLSGCRTTGESARSHSTGHHRDTPAKKAAEAFLPSASSSSELKRTERGG